MDRSLRRHRARTFKARWERRVRMWAKRSGRGWTEADIARVLRAMLETHGCCPCHKDPKYVRKPWKEDGEE
jgi:hypothetical protein